MNARSTLLACSTLAALVACRTEGTGGSANGLPPTRMGDDATTYHGVRTVDTYRWLENGDSPEVKAWIVAQNAHADRIIAANPEGAALARRVEELSTTSPDRFAASLAGGMLFYLRETPPQPQPVLVAQAWPSGEARVLVDVNGAGGSINITAYWPSPRGRYLAYGTASGGSELTTIRFLDVQSGKTLPDSLPYAGGGTSPQALAWDADERGVTYARYPVPEGNAPVSEFDVVLYHHTLGGPSKDPAVFGQGYSKIAEYRLLTSRDGRYAAALANKGDGGPAEVYLRGAMGWERALDASAGVTTATYSGDRLLVVATSGTPRGRVVSLAPNGQVSEILGQSDWAIQSLAPVAGGFLVVKAAGPAWRVDHYAANGTLVRSVRLPGEGVGVEEIASSSESNEALIAYSGWTAPTRWAQYDGKAGALTDVFAVKPAADYSHVTAHVIEATSKDGTKVPVTVLALDGAPRDGSAPAILYGYGGFDIPTAPAFIGSNLAWLERGGVLAYANIRGGSEYGEAWHQGGMLTRKQNVFDDFYAAAQALVHERWTSANHLGIRGGSNGGLLMGASLTQHPEAYRAVVSFVGIYDMLRHQTFPNGAYNVTEYGATEDSTQFAALYAYSPLHHVQRGTSYPAVLLETGVNDPRVAPWQSRKFVAALQAATTSRRPVALLTRMEAGHGIGAPFSQRVGNAAVALTFFAHELGLGPAVRAAQGIR
jgi:prolyl oligopeptidase